MGDRRLIGFDGKRVEMGKMAGKLRNFRGMGQGRLWCIFEFLTKKLQCKSS